VVLHPISKIEVYSTSNLGPANRAFIPQVEKILEKVEVRFYARKSFAEMDRWLQEEWSWGADCRSQSHNTTATLEEKDEPVPPNPLLKKSSKTTISLALGLGKLSPDGTLQLPSS
jgi:hypothetical protein